MAQAPQQRMVGPEVADGMIVDLIEDLVAPLGAILLHLLTVLDPLGPVGRPFRRAAPCGLRYGRVRDLRRGAHHGSRLARPPAGPPPRGSAGTRPPRHRRPRHRRPQPRQRRPDASRRRQWPPWMPWACPGSSASRLLEGRVPALGRPAAGVDGRPADGVDGRAEGVDGRLTDGVEGRLTAGAEGRLTDGAGRLTEGARLTDALGRLPPPPPREPPPPPPPPRPPPPPPRASKSPAAKRHTTDNDHQ